MSTATFTKTTTPSGLNPTVLARILDEGYGPGSWHGPDLKTALDDVKPTIAFRRPATDRHNIAEVALHHAYFIRSVRGQLSGSTPEPFVLEGEDWFVVNDKTTFTWPKIRSIVEAEQRRLGHVVSDIASGRVRSPLGDAEIFDLVLGITCHAVYHAGQVQLIKRLNDGV